MHVDGLPIDSGSLSQFMHTDGLHTSIMKLAGATTGYGDRILGSQDVLTT